MALGKNVTKSAEKNKSRRTHATFFACLAFAFFIVLFSARSYSFDALSDLITAHEYDDISDFSATLDSLHKTAFYGWSTGDESTPELITDRRLGNYILNCPTTEKGHDLPQIFLIASPSSPLDLHDRRYVCFMLKNTYGSDSEKNGRVSIKLFSGNEKLSFSKEIAGEKYSLISVCVGTWKYRNAIDKIEIRVTGNSGGSVISSAQISGPYVSGNRVNQNEKFMSDAFSASGSEIETIDRGKKSEAMKLTLGSQRVTLTGTPTAAFRDEEANAVRIIMTSSSDYEGFSFRYSVLDPNTGHVSLQTREIRLEANAKRFSYIIPTGNVDNITEFSIIFDGSRSGEALIYSIAPVSIYEGYLGGVYADVTECKKNEKTDTINVLGNIHHSFLTSHDSYTVECYRLGVGETLDDALLRGDSPVGTSPMTSHFAFKLKLSRLGTYACVSKYALAARSESGDVIQLCAPVSVSGTFGRMETASGRTNIKGINSDYTSVAIDGGMGVSVIDVYLDRLISASHSGHIYTTDNSFIYFDASYIGELDRKIKNLCAADCKVYLRFIVSADCDAESISYVRADEDGKAEYLGVVLDSTDAMRDFFAVTDFICKRYSGFTNGKISGLILGKSVDLASVQNFTGIAGLTEYALNVAKTFEFMARCASDEIPGIEVVLPISDSRASGTGYDTEILLTSICAYLDDGGGLDFSLMLESTHVPYSIRSDMFENDIIYIDEDGNVTENDTDPIKVVRSDEESDFYCTDNIYTFERMLDYLDCISESAPISYIFYWEPNLEKIGNGLSAAYIYNYYSLMFSERAGAFVTYFPSGDIGTAGIKKLAYIMKYIDTERNESGEMCDAVLSVFGVESWDEIIENYDPNLLVHRIFHEETARDSLPTDIKGSFTLWDFSAAFGTLGWFEGGNCKSVTIDAAAKNGRSLRADLTAGAADLYGYSDFVYSFEYPDDISFAPYLEFDVSTDETDESTLYEIMIVICGDGHRTEAKTVIASGKTAGIVVNASADGQASHISCIRICARTISGSAEDFSLYIKKITAHSTEFDDAALKSSFEKSRAESRHTEISDAQDERPRYEVAAALAVLIFLSIALIAFYDRNKRGN